MLVGKSIDIIVIVSYILVMPIETKLSDNLHKSLPNPRMKNDNLIKFNELKKKGGRPKGRKSFAKTLEIYVKQYLNSDVSVRHFQKWADQKPGEALPWAWKVVYGDGNGTLGPQKGQVNVLIQILTGRTTAPLLIEPDNVPRGTLDNIPSPEGQGNQLPQVVESQSSDTLPVVVTVPIPENPENR